MVFFFILVHLRDHNQDQSRLTFLKYQKGVCFESWFLRIYMISNEDREGPETMSFVFFRLDFHEKVLSLDICSIRSAWKFFLSLEEVCEFLLRHYKKQLEVFILKIYASNFEQMKSLREKKVKLHAKFRKITKWAVHQCEFFLILLAPDFGPEPNPKIKIWEISI